MIAPPLHAGATDRSGSFDTFVELRRVVVEVAQQLRARTAGFSRSPSTDGAASARAAVRQGLRRRRDAHDRSHFTVVERGKAHVLGVSGRDERLDAFGAIGADLVVAEGGDDEEPAGPPARRREDVEATSMSRDWPSARPR